MIDPAAENRNLRRVLEIARQMAVTPDLDALLRTIVDAACDVLDCERATIFLYDAKSDELYSRVAKDVAGIRFPSDRGIAGAAAKQRVCVNVPDAYADGRFNREVDKRTGFITRNLLTLPMENLNGQLIGVLQALNKRGRAFDAVDEELARALGAQAGVALDRGRLIEEYATKQRMSRDLEIARGIQHALFPREDPRVEAYDVAGWNRSADETGGDCYDFVPLDGGRLAIFLADATGHGIGSALIIAQARAALRALLTTTDDLRTIATALNRLLADDLTDDRFVTAFLGILDPAAHRLEYIAAGQGPLVLVTRDEAESRGASALPLAVLEDFEFASTAEFVFGVGDTLLLLTDGFYEACDAGDEQFGEARVVELVREHAADALPAMIRVLHEAVASHVGALPQADDLTAVVVRRAK